MLLITVTLTALTGCAPKPTISDANNFILIQNELVKLKNYRESILSCRDELVCVPINYKANLTEPPTPIFVELRNYLDKNDCTLLPKEQFIDCYKQTRVRLIQTTEQLDGLALDNYVLNRTITRLINNIDVIINDFPKVDLVKP